MAGAIRRSEYLNQIGKSNGKERQRVMRDQSGQWVNGDRQQIAVDDVEVRSPGSGVSLLAAGGGIWRWSTGIDGDLRHGCQGLALGLCVSSSRLMRSGNRDDVEVQSDTVVV